MLEEILTKIGFDWKLAITHFLNFLILFFIIIKFVLPKLKAIINERTKKIEDGIKKSIEAEKVLLDAKANANNIIQNGRIEQNNILQKAESEKKNILANAEAEAQRIKEYANLKLQNAEEEGRKMGQKEIENNLSKILKSLSLKAFDDKLTPEINDEFIQKIFSR